MNIPLTIIIIFLAVVLFTAAFVLMRTLRFARPLPNVEAGESIEVDEAAAAAHLGEAIRCKTISFSEKQPASPESLLTLHEILSKNYPEVHKQLTRQKINEYSLLYTWPGSNPDLEAVLLMAHQDVVPVDPDTLDKWEHAPFSGEEADGFVWGRGALDIKNQLTAILEAVEQLLKTGFQPKRTVYLAFGHDEEIGGPNGAKAIAHHLQEQGVRLAAVLDEGMPILQGSLPGVEIPVALIGNSEKGYLTLLFSTELEAGHASTPPKQTAIGILAKALSRLEDNPNARQPREDEAAVPGHRRGRPAGHANGLCQPVAVQRRCQQETLRAANHQRRYAHHHRGHHPPGRCKRQHPAKTGPGRGQFPPAARRHDPRCLRPCA